MIAHFTVVCLETWPLVADSDVFCFIQAGIWLRQGECLHSLGRLEEAASAYAQVVNLAPNHLDARLVLASLHQQLGRPNQALDVLSGESSKRDIATGILLCFKAN